MASRRPGPAVLELEEGDCQQRRAAQYDEHPERPPLFPPLGKRHDDRRQGQGDQCGAAQVEAHVTIAAGFRNNL